MMELKNGVANDVYIRVVAGTVAEISDQLHTQYLTQGYSLLKEDIEQALIGEVQYFASRCAVLQCQRDAPQPSFVGVDTLLEGDEWAVIDPVIRARVDLIQARLMEGSNSLMNGQPFGMSVSEALATYNDKRTIMQLEGFIEPPFSFKTLDGS